MFSYIDVCVADFDEANLFGECITRFGIFRVKFWVFFLCCSVWDNVFDC